MHILSDSATSLKEGLYVNYLNHSLYSSKHVLCLLFLLTNFFCKLMVCESKPFLNQLHHTQNIIKSVQSFGKNLVSKQGQRNISLHISGFKRHFKDHFVCTYFALLLFVSCLFSLSFRELLPFYTGGVLVNRKV